MTPSQIIALIRDAVVIGALAWVVMFLYRSGENAVRVSDIEAVQKQLLANAQTQDRYRTEINDALSEANSQMGNLAHSIDANQRPVIVRVAPSSGPVPSNSASPPSPDPGAGTVDVRPGINAFERKYEEALAECRALRDAWPR